MPVSFWWLNVHQGRSGEMLRSYNGYLWTVEHCTSARKDILGYFSRRGPDRSTENSKNECRFTGSEKSLRKWTSGKIVLLSVCISDLQDSSEFHEFPRTKVVPRFDRSADDDSNAEFGELLVLS